MPKQISWIRLFPALFFGFVMDSTGASLPVASVPEDGATAVAIGRPIELRFAQPVDATSLNGETITLLGPPGAVPIEVVPDRSGRAVEVRPKQDLLTGSRYTLFASHIKLTDGSELPFTTVSFSTQALPSSSEDSTANMASPTSNADQSLQGTTVLADCPTKHTLRSYLFCKSVGTVDGGVFTPGFGNTQARWRLNKKSPAVPTAKDFPAAKVSVGATSVFGAVLRIDDSPLSNVTVSIGKISAQTDKKGRFLLTDVPAGHQVLRVYGGSANHGDEEYGQFSAALNLKEGQPNAVPYNMYVPRITSRDKVSVASPTTQETIITHPAIPGLEIHIPAGVVFRDTNGKVLTEFAIVPMPVDRAPTPVPENFPVYFSTQPDGATVEGLTVASASGLRVVYPNYSDEISKDYAFWYYDVDHDGWKIYTHGHASADGKTIVADSALGGIKFMPEGGPSAGGPAPPTRTCHSGGAFDGDPVDCASGIFLHTRTDLSNSGAMPLTFTRTYSSGDPTANRPFGKGMSHLYAMYLFAPEGACFDTEGVGTELDLVTGDGAVYPFFLPGKRLS